MILGPVDLLTNMLSGSANKVPKTIQNVTTCDEIHYLLGVRFGSCLGILVIIWPKCDVPELSSISVPSNITNMRKQNIEFDVCS